MNMPTLSGAGLGFRRELVPALEQQVPAYINFFEIAPENWIDSTKQDNHLLRSFTERYPFACHGLSLSLGGLSDLNVELLKKIKQFLKDHQITLYTEHLSWCSDHGQLYDLLPIPFTEEAVTYVASRIRQAQDILEQRIAVENASFYVQAPINEMDEASFIQAVINEADCDLHLDINNVYVNSINHNYDPYKLLDALPKERIVYMHMAGHYKEAEDLLVDTHGAAVIEPVWDLLAYSYEHLGVFPTLLERDFNIPPLSELTVEVERISQLQQQNAPQSLSA